MITNAKHLLSYVKLAEPAVPSNPHVPILENFLLKSVDGYLNIVASSMHDVIVVKTDIEFNQEVCIPASLFSKLLSGIGDKPIQVDIDPDNYSVTVKSGKSKSKISGQDPKDFPRIAQSSSNEVVRFTVEHSLISSLRTLATFCGNDEFRPAMTGINVISKDGILELCATDGTRLLVEKHDIDVDGEFQFTVPSHVAKVLNSSMPISNFTVAVLSNNVRFESDVVTFICRLIDERFPDYNNVIPKENGKVAKLLNSELSSALKRVMLFSNKTTNQVKLQFTENELRISAEDLDYSNESSESIDLIDYKGESIEIGFNGKLLSELLKVLGSSVKIELSLPNRATLFFEDLDGSDVEKNKLALLMPVMLNKYS